MEQIQPEHHRFYDPDLGPGNEMTIVLRRVGGGGPEAWYLDRRIAYRDRRLHEAGEPDIVVPRDVETFTTDLTSVPQLLTWLVGRTGNHLPAALLHDALTPPFSDRDDAGNELPDWEGPAHIDQIEADRIFRDAMADVGTPLIRRWLIWAGVSVPAAWTVGRARAIAGYLMLAVTVVLGYLATLDLFDQIELLPWMGDRPWNRELIFGAAAAVVVPLLLAVVWPPGLYRAGAIVGVAIAALLHVTLAVAAVTAAYQLAEYRHRVFDPPHRALKVAGALAAIGVVALTIWICNRG